MVNKIIFIILSSVNKQIFGTNVFSEVLQGHISRLKVKFSEVFSFLI